MGFAEVVCKFIVKDLGELFGVFEVALEVETFPRTMIMPFFYHRALKLHNFERLVNRGIYRRASDYDNFIHNQ